MKKKYIILITIIIIYFLVFFFIFGFDKIKKDNLNTLLIIDNNSMWKLEKNSWENIDNFDTYNYKDFNVYLDSKNVGIYKMMFNDNWYLLDKNSNKPVNTFYSYLFAYNGNYEIDVKNVQPRKNTNNQIISKVLIDNGINGSVSLTSNFVYELDIDSDGTNEKIYTISNAFSKSETYEKAFAFVVMEKDDNLLYLFNEVEDNDGVSGCKPFINKVIDVNLDGVYELVLSCGRFSSQKRDDYLYEFYKGRFNLLISNK